MPITLCVPPGGGGGVSNLEKVGCKNLCKLGRKNKTTFV